MTAASNADSWAAERVGIYFQGFPSTLDGQCVSLIKWFLGDMCNVQDWKLARGDAKDYGDTLVRQGLASVVPAAQRKRGDIVVWKQDGHGFGHIGVLLSGDMVFEENVGLVGTPSKMVGDFRVYSSRIDPLSSSWRTGSPTFYRVKSYIENKQTAPAVTTPAKGGDMITRKGLEAVFLAHLGRMPDTDAYTHYVGNYDIDFTVNDVKKSDEYKSHQKVVAQAKADATLGQKARTDKWQQQIYDLQAKLKNAAPASVSDADKKLQAIKDALGIK